MPFLLQSHIREESFDEVINNLAVENQGLRKVLKRGKSAKVIAAKVKKEAGKSERWVDVEKMVSRKDRQVAASRLFEIACISDLVVYLLQNVDTS